MWTIEQAKSEFDELVARAASGEPQVISGAPPCVVLSLPEYERLKRDHNRPPLGVWLVENAPQVGDLELPARTRDRPVPFDDWPDEEAAAE